jgi:hypothetical protein
MVVDPTRNVSRERGWVEGMGGGIRRWDEIAERLPIAYPKPARRAFALTPCPPVTY